MLGKRVPGPLAHRFATVASKVAPFLASETARQLSQTPSVQVLNQPHRSLVALLHVLGHGKKERGALAPSSAVAELEPALWCARKLLELPLALFKIANAPGSNLQQLKLVAQTLVRLSLGVSLVSGANVRSPAVVEHKLGQSIASTLLQDRRRTTLSAQVLNLTPAKPATLRHVQSMPGKPQNGPLLLAQPNVVNLAFLKAALSPATRL
mmetsp:Transcript_44580/g.87319  ORF Transcript_44580/g.87319 Transcript_44580/m.87319 type:complete len:209 (-) Transcript_44580:978-1604(-)